MQECCPKADLLSLSLANRDLGSSSGCFCSQQDESAPKLNWSSPEKFTFNGTVCKRSEGPKIRYPIPCSTASDLLLFGRLDRVPKTHSSVRMLFLDTVFRSLMETSCSMSQTKRSSLGSWPKAGAGGTLDSRGWLSTRCNCSLLPKPGLSIML